MKLLIIVTLLIFFIINPIKAIDLKIVYINTDKILNESKAGKDIKKELDSINKKNISKFEKIEKEIKHMFSLFFIIFFHFFQVWKSFLIILTSNSDSMRKILPRTGWKCLESEI